MNIWSGEANLFFLYQKSKLFRTEVKIQSVLIIFPDPQLAYSPTTLNLFHALKEYFDVRLLSAPPEESYSLQKVDDPQIEYLDFQPAPFIPPPLWKRVRNRLKRALIPAASQISPAQMMMTARAQKIVDRIRAFDGQVIAVDFFSLWCAQQAGKRAHLISFEIHVTDIYRDACDPRLISSVIIQSKERYDFLFKNTKPRYFIIQNAPRYLELKPDYHLRNKNALVYCGSAMPAFGIFSCLDFIKDYEEYTLTIKGAVPKTVREAIDLYYPDLLAQKRLILEGNYLPPDELTRFVSQFRIGFAFYDFYRFDAVRSFNYFTAPSGKVFQYLNSGVPIVANDLPAFEFFSKSNAGRTVNYLGSKAIKKAIDSIEENYTQIAENAKHLSQAVDFSENSSEFIRYLISLTTNNAG